MDNALYGFMPEAVATVGDDYVAKWKLLADAVPAEARDARPVTLKGMPEGVSQADLDVLVGVGAVEVAADGTITLMLNEAAPAPAAPAKAGTKAPEGEFARGLRRRR